jgi:sialate O-acetylesterase
MMTASLRRLLSGLLIAGLSISFSAQAEVVPSVLFGDNAVLQQGRKVPVWGTAAEGEKVSVSFGEQKAETVAKDGKWMVWLDPMKADTTPKTLTITGSTNTVTSTNILVGEVWVCSGQSNMERKLPELVNKTNAVLSQKWKQDAAAANYPEIRHLTVPRTTATNPVTTLVSQWEICSPQTVTNFTAVGYYFGRDIHRDLNVPVGLIHSSWGGTPAEAWTRHEVLAINPIFTPILDRFTNAVATYATRLAKYQADEPKLLVDYTNAYAEADAQGRPNPLRPTPPPNPSEDPHTPSILFNGMINPLLPYAIRGVIWYQGESNSARAKEYHDLFPAMIGDWRAQWRQGDFPFLFVQIAPFKRMLPEIREAQLMTLGKVPNTAMAVTTDVGDFHDIHPIQKEPVGERLALAARALAYGELLEYSGPLYKSARTNGNAIMISFDHAGMGLVAKGGPLKGFVLAGSDKTFVPAKAEIQGKTVVVTAPGVSNPVAVRYAWENVPEVNLFNQAGLPASPFRTDDWETQTNPPTAAPLPSPQTSPGR